MKKPIILIFVSAIAALFVGTQISFANKIASPLLASPPLSEKTILAILMANLDIPLKNAAHCDGVGIDEHDRTIGDYLSGFWSFHTNKKSKNWLEINATKSAKNLYLAKLMIYQKNEGESWGWGVSFELDSNKKVNRNSFTCLGAG